MKNYLPIGSVVLLKEAKKRIMICGWMQKQADGTMYDYSGCLFPEGIINSDELLLFNDEEIEHLFFVGMQDQEQMEFAKRVKEAIGESENK